MSNTLVDLENKVWWRALKVIYIGVYLVLVVIILLLSLSEAPKTYKENGNSIVCSNGKIYPFRIDQPTLGDDISIRAFCANISSDEELKFMPQALNKGLSSDQIMGYLESKKFPKINYKIEPIINHYGGWNLVLRDMLIGIGIVWLFMNIIRYTCIYIITGKNQTKNSF